MYRRNILRLLACESLNDETQSTASLHPICFCVNSNRLQISHPTSLLIIQQPNLYSIISLI